MAGSFKTGEPVLRWSWPGTKLFLTGATAFGLSVALLIITAALRNLSDFSGVTQLSTLGVKTSHAAWLLVLVGALLVTSGVFLNLWAPGRYQLFWYSRQRLYAHRFGNPLGLRAGEVLPRLSVTRDRKEGYWVRVDAVSASVEEITRATAALSAGTRGKLEGFAVTDVDEDPASRFVRFHFEDVLKDRSIHVGSLADLDSGDPTKLLVQEGTTIDLETSGSMIIAGKTRSGKTTGVLSLLLQVAAFGPDTHGSSLVIVDPKQAELSRVPGTVTLDEEGSAKPVLAAMRNLEATMRERQRFLGDISEKSGTAQTWWGAGLRPSLLFIDEFVALRSLLPARASKDTPGYSQKIFDDSLRRLITMGAAAGVFVMISIAQASAEQLPTMLRDAFSTRILFRPTKDEAAFLWDPRLFQALPQTTHGPGDAWFSSTDGIHDSVSLAHFPRFQPGFGEYRVLGDLLRKYNNPGVSHDTEIER